MSMNKRKHGSKKKKIEEKGQERILSDFKLKRIIKSFREISNSIHLIGPNCCHCQNEQAADYKL